MGDFRKLIVTALLTAFVGGCASSTSVAPTDTQFVDGSPDAIVVIGLRSALPIVTTGGSTYPDFQMAWEMLPAPGMNPKTPRLMLVDTSDLSAAFEDKKPNDITLHVVRVPAGTYYLRQVSTESSQSRYTLQPMGAPGAPFFTVQPGEVRYIGDIHCDVISRPARCNTLTRNDALAYMALSQYPGIRVKPQFRAPAYSPAADEPARVIPVSN